MNKGSSKILSKTKSSLKKACERYQDLSEKKEKQKERISSQMM